MVVALQDSKHRAHRFELRPNQSLTRKGAVVFYLAIATTTLAIAAMFVYVGLWMVLPFAGLEIAALGAALYYLLSYRARAREFILIDEDSVRVASGKAGKPHWDRDRFPRGWTRVRIERSPLHWYPTRLVIGSHGRRREIGAFLTDDERKLLAGELKQALDWRARARAA